MRILFLGVEEEKDKNLKKISVSCMNFTRSAHIKTMNFLYIQVILPLIGPEHGTLCLGLCLCCAALGALHLATLGFTMRENPAILGAS